MPTHRLTSNSAPQSQGGASAQGCQLVHARMVNQGQVIDGSLLIAHGRIVGMNQPTPAGAEVIDLQGAWLLPGMIDHQVHFREPGFEHKGTIASESAAAIAGGITSYMELPDSNPATIDQAALLDKHARAADHSAANFAFYLGASNHNIEAINAVDPRLTCGIQVVIGASTNNPLAASEQTLERLFASTELLIASHCEDAATLAANQKAAAARHGDAIPFSEHPNIFSADASYRACAHAVDLAKRFNARLHVLRLSSAQELELFEPDDSCAKRISAAACVPHLFFSDRWYEDKGGLILCNPAIRSRNDQLALLQAVNEGRIDAIATDHAPHTQSEKAHAYARVPAGLPLVQHALIALFEHVHAGMLDMTQVVQKTAHNPAQLFGVRERGYLREGYHADLVVVDDRRHSGSDALAGDTLPKPLSKCGWSPFEHIDLHARVRGTWVNGVLRYCNGAFLPGPAGQPLQFDRG